MHIYKEFNLKRVNFYMAVFAVFLIFFACSKSNETANAGLKPEKQTAPAVQNTLTQTSEKILPAKSKDENGWYHDWDEGIAAVYRRDGLCGQLCPANSEVFQILPGLENAA